MPSNFKQLRRVSRFLLDLMLGLFVLGLFLVVWASPRTHAAAGDIAKETRSTPEPASAFSQKDLIPISGTPVVAMINGSIDGTEPAFTGQRHFRSGIAGDRNCALFGVVGARHYDEFKFFNNSSTPQRVNIAFISGCGANTYMAAFAPQFDPTSICTNYISSPGLSESIVWEFTVCANSQFSIVVYGLEPGLTCVNYSLTVYANNTVFLGGPKDLPGGQPGKGGVDSGLASMDAVVERHKRKIPGADTRFELVPPTGMPPPVDGLLPTQGTPFVAMIQDSISTGDRSFVGQRHFLSGIAGDGNCMPFGPIGSRFYDEVFFRNNSPKAEIVEVQITGGCVSSAGPVMVMAAYAPQFNPNDICDGFIATSAFPRFTTWKFRVCPNAQFSIVVYGANPGGTCSSYSYTVFASEVALIGGPTDLSIVKTGPSGPISAGSNITYNITLANNGPTAAGGIVFTDPLPNGTTFVSLSLLSNLGTALPAPICTTPPVGSPGAVQCSLNLLGIPGTGLPNSVAYALTLRTGPQSGGTITNIASVTFPGTDTNPANNSSSVTTTISSSFDVCLQDDSNHSLLQFNSVTGDYLFTSCEGVVIGGRGSVAVKGSIATLQDFTADRRVFARIDRSAMKGTATIETFSPARVFTITDRNTANNTCACS